MNSENAIDVLIHSWHDCNKDDKILEDSKLSYRHGQNFTRSEYSLALELAGNIAIDIFRNAKLNVMLLKSDKQIVVAVTSYRNFGQR